MAYEFDPAKSKKNKADKSRGFGFELVAEFEWETAITVPDQRNNYGEDRQISYGLIRERLYVLVWTPRIAKRVISLRKANNKERHWYEKKRADSH